MESSITEQIAYYRARAGEYDDWWARRGQYALPAEQERLWGDDVAEAEAALESFSPQGRVLELACGTGLWTRHLATHASHLTAVDASPEVLELNRARLAGHRIDVDYVAADLFEWKPAAGSYDVVAFTYWLSHVPDDRLDAFWSVVRSALAPGGRVFLVDSAPNPSAPAAAPGGRHEQRRLEDGRRFVVHKRYWAPAELESDLRGRGWRATARFAKNQMMLIATASLSG